MKRTVKQMMIGKEAFIFLNQTMREQRGFGLATDEVNDRMWAKAVKFGGKYCAYDGCFGGANERGKWTSWKVDDMKRMLKEAGIPYDCAEDGEIINI